MPPLFSHSRLSSFESCPKKYHFRYVQKLEVDSEGIEAFVGKRVHEVLERLYQFVEKGMVPPLEKVVDRYRALWQEHFDPERIRIAREGTPVSFYVDLGERGLCNYYRKNYPFDQTETLALEKRLVFALDSAGEYRMQGFVDRIARAPDGTLEIHDYKTGRPSTQRQADSDRQLALYQIGATELYGNEAPVRLVWHFVSKNLVRTSERTPEQLTTLCSNTIALIDRIAEESEFAAHKTPLCSWCEYKSICPAWQSLETPSPAGPAVATGRPQLDLL